MDATSSCPSAFSSSSWFLSVRFFRRLPEANRVRSLSIASTANKPEIVSHSLDFGNYSDKCRMHSCFCILRFNPVKNHYYTKQSLIPHLDASIWLNQFVKAMRDSSGRLLANAPLKGLWSRILKLLYYKIKYVFTFQRFSDYSFFSSTISNEAVDQSSCLMEVLLRSRKELLKRENKREIKRARELKHLLGVFSYTVIYCMYRWSSVPTRY